MQSPLGARQHNEAEPIKFKMALSSSRPGCDAKRGKHDAVDDASAHHGMQTKNDSNGDNGTNNSDGNSNTNTNGHCARQQQREQGPKTTNCSFGMDVPSDCCSNSEDGNNEHKDVHATATNASANNGMQQTGIKCKRPLDDLSDCSSEPDEHHKLNNIHDATCCNKDKPASPGFAHNAPGLRTRARVTR